MSEGEKRYDGGRSTVVVGVGVADAPACEQAARMPPRTIPAIARRRRMAMSGTRSVGRPGQEGPAHCGEYESERQKIEDLADRVREQERRPVEVVGHVADLGQREEGKAPTECRGAGSERSPRKEGAGREQDDVDGEEPDGRDRVDEVTEWHREDSFTAGGAGSLYGSRRRSRRRGRRPCR